jgi:UDP-glucose 4-epimerase
MAKNLNSRVFNIGTGIGVTLKDVAAILRKHLPNAVIEVGPGLNFLGSPYPMHGVYDISRAQKELGYRSEYDLERGIADYLESLQRLKLQAA